MIFLRYRAYVLFVVFSLIYSSAPRAPRAGLPETQRRSEKDAVVLKVLPEPTLREFGPDLPISY